MPRIWLVNNKKETIMLAVENATYFNSNKKLKVQSFVFNVRKWKIISISFKYSCHNWVVCVEDSMSAPLLFQIKIPQPSNSS